jgi:predicted ABC-type transport system involved in lysophospholipase L1 biosynthesis ATPase subunit
MTTQVELLQGTHDQRLARGAQRTIRLFDGQIVSQEVAAAR